jgi:multicomponent Na+:H+ antiporter subunit D
VSGANWAVNAAVIFINLGTIISFIKYSSMLLGRHERGEEQAIAKVDKCQQAAVLILSAFCLVGGIFGVQFIQFLFNISVSVDATGYLEKVISFVISVGAGLLIYKYYVKNSRLFKQIREVELSFRGICVSMGIFFAIVLIVTRILY